MSIRLKVVFTGLYLLLLLLVTSVSAWLYLPGVRSRILEEYSARFNPIIPRSEFRVNPHAIKRNEDGSYSYVSNNRHITVKGMTTTVVMPDGTVETRYMGKVTKVPKETWEEIVGATTSANIDDQGQAIDLQSNRIALKLEKEIKIVEIPDEAIVERIALSFTNKAILSAANKTPAKLSDIVENDTVLYSMTDNLQRLSIIQHQ